MSTGHYLHMEASAMLPSQSICLLTDTEGLIVCSFTATCTAQARDGSNITLNMTVWTQSSSNRVANRASLG